MLFLEARPCADLHDAGLDPHSNPTTSCLPIKDNTQVEGSREDDGNMEKLVDYKEDDAV